MHYFLLFLCVLSISFPSTPLQDFKWGELKPRSILQSKGTTTLNSPVFLYSIAEKKKLSDKMSRMVSEIKYLREKVSSYSGGVETLKAHILDIEGKHAQERINMEATIATHRKSLESLSIVIERLAKGDSGKNFWSHIKDALITYGAIRH